MGNTGTGVMSIIKNPYFSMGVATVFVLFLVVLFIVLRNKKKKSHKKLQRVPNAPIGYTGDEINAERRVNKDDGSPVEITEKLSASAMKPVVEMPRPAPSGGGAPDVPCVFTVERSIMYTHTSEEII